MPNNKTTVMMENIQEGIAQALCEYASTLEDLAFTNKAKPPADVIISTKDGPANNAIPRIVLDPVKKIRLSDLARDIAQRALAPSLYIDDLHVGGFRFSPAERTLEKDGIDTITLTDREADILAYLARFRGAPVMRDDLLAAVWKFQQGLDTHTLETHVYRLRQKLGDNAEKIIATRDGGYFMPEKTSE